MTNQEFSNTFTTLLNSYNTQAQFGEQASKREIVLDEYEKSVLLTKAQEELVISYYNGKNPFGDSFESTEEMRRYLDSLIKTKTYLPQDKVESTKLSSDSVLFKLPSDLMFITLEQVTFDAERLGCANGSTASVHPVTQDEYSEVKGNPFRGPSKYRVIRLDSGEGLVELVSKSDIGKYLIKYLSKPTPIILETLPDGLTIEGKQEETECQLNSVLHETILERAVQMALQAKGISVSK